MANTTIKRIGLILIVCLITLTAGIYLGDSAKACAATKCYTIGTSNVQVYSNTGLTKKYGTIFSSDEITVNSVTDRYCKVTYPITRGTKTGYISTYKILTKTIGNSYTSRAKITTYRRANNKNSYGYVAKGDSVKVLGVSGSYTQVKYPVSGGYKYAFIRTSDLNLHVLPSVASSSNIPNGTYKLMSAINNRFVIDIDGASLSDSANVQLYEDNETNAQKFIFTKQADGYYTISNVNSKKLLDCSGAGKTNGTNIQQYTPNNTSAQRWKVTSVGNGYYTLSCKCNGLFIDAAGGIGTNGTNIQMYAANGTLAQRWKLIPTSASSQSNTAQKIVDFELSQIGIGDSKGNNNVIYNTWYYGRPVSGNGYAWCMAFQSYCANQMGVLNSAIPKTASCAEAVKWYKNKGQFQAGQYYGGSYTPKAGDLVFYYNGSFCHVGMITSAPVNGFLQTVEGNIICSDGNYKVVQFTKNNKRTVNNSYVYGYGTNEFADSGFIESKNRLLILDVFY